MRNAGMKRNYDPDLYFILSQLCEWLKSGLFERYSDDGESLCTAPPLLFSFFDKALARDIFGIKLMLWFLKTTKNFHLIFCVYPLLLLLYVWRIYYANVQTHVLVFYLDTMLSPSLSFSS